MPGQAKYPTQGKSVSCCGLLNIAEVGIAGPKWCEIKTAVKCSIYRELYSSSVLPVAGYNKN
jgi:hypothetical protein